MHFMPVKNLVFQIKTWWLFQYATFCCVLGRGLVGAITFYRSLCNDLCSRVDQERLLAFTDFFFSTFMKHYRLYQCVMSTSPLRESISSSLVLPVRGPPQPIQPLKKGVSQEVWEYEQAVRKLEKSRDEMKKKRQSEKYYHEKEEAQQFAEVQCRISDLGDPVNLQVSLIIFTRMPCRRSCYRWYFTIYTFLFNLWRSVNSGEVMTQ